ncbi:MAG: RNA-binding S4 domain-containing protein [Bacteroidales bacterium]|nr:RNA-binding S4 domain-containing protein [Bacteroidales bacterium]MBO5854220.1 RNA-binding S4 domain-containing protein [Bacteroidales bacterium]
MQEIIFELREGDEFIPLIALLKATGLVDSGSMAQEVVTAGLVKRNGETELRKRAKIVSGDVIEFEGYLVKIKKC